MDGDFGHQQKQERSRMRWTAALDKIFVDLIVQQIQQGNRRNNIFDKKTWNTICSEFNRKTNLNFNNNQLRKHFDVLRTRFYHLKSSVNQNQLAVDDSSGMGSDFWDDLGTQQRPGSGNTKECPIYEQLSTIFADAAAEGIYAQSSHYEELNKSVGAAPTNPKLIMENGLETVTHSSMMQSSVGMLDAERKKKRPCSSKESMDQRLDSMARAMLDMIAVSELKSVAPEPGEDIYSISNCIKTLDEMNGIDDKIYFAAVEIFEDPDSREAFIRMNNQCKRLAWLQGQFGSFKV